jgi:cyclopropane-fatty-acyl-phospholipid synthase
MSLLLSSASSSLASACALLWQHPRQAYDGVRPHHVLLLLAASRALSATRLYQRVVTALSTLSEQCVPLIHAGLVPDVLIRLGIRLQLRAHLQRLTAVSAVDELATKTAIVQELHDLPVAIATDEANAQHYEVPARFYDLCLGPCKKYSSGLWSTPDTTFEESETAMLDLYCERAQLRDAMKVVDLGCGWGSLTLHVAAKYPNCQITGISNSHSQRDYILRTAAERGLNVQNITIVTVRRLFVVSFCCRCCRCCCCCCCRLGWTRRK